MREWRRRALHVIGLLLLSLAVCAVGLVALDSSSLPLAAKLFRGIWNAVNLITTLGNFTLFNDSQKLFMIAAMFAFIVFGGYVLAQLTGILSSDAVMALRENRVAERSLNQLTQHVVVLGFSPIGQLVAQKLQATGETVVIIERHDTLAAKASELGYLVVQPDAVTGADDDALKRSGVDSAKAFVITTEEPDRNVALTLMAHALNPKLKIAVTGANRQRGALLQRAGASEVIIADDLIASALVGRLDGKGKRDE
jgi:voltage-gated potassium channel Kch